MVLYSTEFSDFYDFLQNFDTNLIKFSLTHEIHSDIISYVVFGKFCYLQQDTSRIERVLKSDFPVKT